MIFFYLIIHLQVLCHILNASKPFVFITLDGQAAAVRLSKHLKKATRAMKDLVIKFNALGASSHSVVEFAELLDPQSPIYSDVDSFSQVILRILIIVP